VTAGEVCGEKVRVTRLLCSGVVLLMLPTFALGGLVNKERPRVGLSVRIVPKTPIGGTIYAIVRLENDSNGPVWLNGRLVVGPSLGPVPIRTRNLWFDVTFGNTEQVVDRCSLGIARRQFKPEDYRLLRPGEFIDVDADLSCFDLSRLGRYTIVVHYLDQKDKPAPPKESYPLNEELVSVPVSFDVMGASRRVQ